MNNRRLVIDLTPDGQLAAALARAEAAEAEVARLRDENAEAWRAFDRQQDRGDRLAARVEAAEVGRDEANLKALQAEYRIIQLEAHVAELEAALGGMDNHMARLLTERNHALDRAETLEQLAAAAEWRPGSENPPAPDWYQVGDIGVGVYDLWYSGETWHRSSFQGATYRTPPMSAPDYWRPIPPLPPAPQEPTQ